jgi:hypothetical protein
VAGLLALCAYAAFARGGVGLPHETWFEVGVAVLAAVVATGWLGARSLRPRADRVAIAGLVLLALFAAWVAVSLAWTVAPEDTWQEFNRTFAYLLLAGTALVVGSAVPRAIERIAAGWVVVAVAVALWALAGKIVPGIVDHARDVARLRAPLEYWNALAMVCVLGIAPAIRFATAADLRPRRRAAALIAVFVLLCAAGMTYSRGAIVALVVVLVVVAVTGERRMEALIAFGLAALAAAPILAIAFTVEGLSDNAAPRDDQIRTGLALGASMVAVAVVLGLLALWLMRREHRVRFGARSWGLLALVGVALAAAGITALAVSDRGLEGSVEHAVDEFTDAREDRTFEPGRLLSTSSGNRWAWWQEAGGAFADEPVLGWGAGSFAVSRRQYRLSRVDAGRAHSLPMQTLAETGVVGALLLGAALLALFAAGVRRAARAVARPGARPRRRAARRVGRMVRARVHRLGLGDPRGDRPGDGVPRRARRAVAPARGRGGSGAAGRPETSRGAGFAALAAAVLVLVGVRGVGGAAGVVGQQGGRCAGGRARPLAADAAGCRGRCRPRRAPRSAGRPAALRLGGRRREPRPAARGARRPARGGRAGALEHRGVRRLIGIAVRLADREGVRAASRRALELDPANPQLIAFVRRAQGALAPPEASATATGTPITTPGGVAPPVTPAPPGDGGSATGGAAPVNPPPAPTTPDTP